MSITHFTSTAENWIRKVAVLKSKSKLWPEFYMEHENETYYLSTLVRFEFRDIVFSRHHVESGFLSDHYGLDKLVKRLKENVEMTLAHAVPSPYDDVIKTNLLSLSSKIIENGKDKSIG